MGDAPLTELVEAWLARSNGDMSEWPAYEATVLADRRQLQRAWGSSRDAFSMLLVLAGMHPRDESELVLALTEGLSFALPFAQLAQAQARSPPGSHYDGPSLRQVARLAQTARRTLRDAIEQERAGLDEQLCEAIRRVVPDVVTLEDLGEPGLVTSVDRDRARPTFSCGEGVRVRLEPGVRGSICRVGWNVRYRCWSYWIEGRSERRKAEDLVRE